MKTCSYCGHENSDDASNCRECGTEVKRPSEVPLPEMPKHAGSSPSLNSRQLANVLIKMLGLLACLQSIPSVVAGLLRGLFSSLAEPNRGTNVPNYSWTYAVGSAVYLVIGIWLIIRSRYVVEKVFKDGDS